MAINSDDFNRSNSTTSAGPDWTNRLNTMGVESNAAYPVSIGVDADAMATHNTAMSVDDMQVDIVIGSVPFGIGSHVYAILGANTTGACAYLRVTPSGYAGLPAAIYTKPDWATAGTQRDTSTSYVSFVSGDKLSIKRVGNVYTGLKNDSEITGLSWTDSGNIVPRDSSHRLVGIGGFRDFEVGGPSVDGYVTIDSFSARDEAGVGVRMKLGPVPIFRASYY